MNRYISLLLVISFFLGCEQEVTTLEGDVVGTVDLFDGSGYPKENKKGINVKLLGTDHKAVTDAQGRFKFDDVDAGWYDVKYWKEGCSETIKQDFSFVGGSRGVIEPVKIYKNPDNKVESVNVVPQDEDYDPEHYYKLTANFSKSGRVDGVVYYHYTSSVSPSSNTGKKYFSSSLPVPDTTKANIYVEFQSESSRINFNNGDKIYYVFYLINPAASFTYSPEELDVSIPEVKASEIFSLTLE